MVQDQDETEVDQNLALEDLDLDQRWVDLEDQDQEWMDPGKTSEALAQDQVWEVLDPGWMGHRCDHLWMGLVLA